MQMYPAYTVAMVLDLYAITFLAMLNVGYRIRFKHYQMLSQISDLPQLDKQHRDQFYRNLEWAATDPSDILSSSGKGSTDAEIRKALGG